MDFKRGSSDGITTIIVALTIWLGAMVGIVYVAVHFIRKFW